MITPKLVRISVLHLKFSLDLPFIGMIIFPRLMDPTGMHMNILSKILNSRGVLNRTWGLTQICKTSTFKIVSLFIFSAMVPSMGLAQATPPAGIDLVKSGSNYILIGPDRQSIQISSGSFGNFSNVYQSSGNLLLALGVGSVSGETVVAVGSEGRVIYSPNNGASFSMASAPSFDGDLTGVAYGNGVWLAVGVSGFDGVVFRSINGSSWTQVATIPGFNPSSIVWTGGQWLAAGSDSFFDGRVFRSINNGLVWSEMVLPAGTDPLLDLASSASGVVIAVGEWGTILKRNNDSSGFFAVGQDLVSATLTSVVVAPDGSFTAGGDETTLVTILGNNTVSVLGAPQPGTGAIEGLLIDGTQLRYVGLQPGTLDATYERFLAPTVSLSGNRVSLTLPTTTDGRSYLLRVSTDSTAWVILQSQTGNGGPLTFDLDLNKTATFVQIVGQ